MLRLLLLLGGALIAAGLVVGFALPVNSGEYDCGSAFHQSGDLYGQQVADTMSGGTGETSCDEARSSARTLPVVLLVLGAVVLVGAPFVAPRSTPDRVTAW